MASPRRRRSTVEGGSPRPPPEEAPAVGAGPSPGAGPKTIEELARLRAAVAELTETVNELARRQQGKAAR